MLVKLSIKKRALKHLNYKPQMKVYLQKEPPDLTEASKFLFKVHQSKNNQPEGEGNK